MANTYRIQVQTKDSTKWGEYSDAQYLVVPMDMTLEQVQATYGQQIEDEKNARIERWGAMIDNPPVKPEPTEEELLAEKQALADELQQKIDQITAQTAELDSKIQAIETAKIQPVEEKPLG